MTVPQYGWHPEIAAKGMRFTARQHGCATSNSVVNMFTYLVDRCAFNQRPDDDAVLKTISHLQRLHRISEFIHKFVVDGFLNIEAVHADAHLPGIAKLIGDRAFHSRVDVCILKDDVRSISPQLHRDFFHGFCGVTHQRFANRCRAGEGDFSHVPAGHNRVADFVRIPGDRVEYPIRYAGLFCQRQQRKSTERRVIGRFDYPGASGCQRRA